MTKAKTNEQNFDVIISGAGPVGLSLANLLTKNGIKTLVLEKKESLSAHSKAPAIWPKTQEILAKMDVLESFEEDAFIHDELKLWDVDNNEELFEIDLKESNAVYPRLMVLPQSKTEYKLLEKLKERKCAHVHFSSELVTFEEEKGEVNATYIEKGKAHTVKAKYLVGCDGAHSRVRKELGLGLRGKTYDMEVALLDIKVEGTLNKPSPAISTVDGLLVAIQIEKNLWRLIVPVKKEFRPNEVAENAARNLFGRPDYEIIWSSTFKLHRRLAGSFAKGRVALAGDAAHLNSPVGGQGMNSGIQDAEILSASLMRALKYNRPDELRIYSEKRRPVINHSVNTFTDYLTKVLLFDNGHYIKRVLKLAAMGVKMPAFRHMLAQRISMV